LKDTTAADTAKTKTVTKNKTDNLEVFCFSFCFLLFFSTLSTLSSSTSSTILSLLSTSTSTSNLLLRAFLIGLEEIFVQEIRLSFEFQEFNQVFTLKNLGFIK